MADGKPEERQERALSRPPAPLGTAPEADGAGRPQERRTAGSGELAPLARPAGAGARSRLEGVARSRWAPLIALLALLAFSIASKSIDLSQPCKAPCKAESAYTPCKAESKAVSSYTLIFDESYYVNAARVIDGIEPPAGCPYHGDPKGNDPNAEHPQLAKLAIAAGIEAFGDNPLGWRIGSIVFAAIAVLALYALVVAAGGSAWLAVGTVAVMCLDNLMLVHGRIATLDIYAVAMMLVAGALYMRRHPLLAGIALGVAACMKEIALFLIFVFVLLEALRIARAWTAARRERTETARATAHAASTARTETTATTETKTATKTAGAGEIRYGSLHRRRLALELAWEHLPRLVLFVASGALATLALLWLLDALVPAYDPGTHVLYSGNPLAHLEHMYSYALLLKSKPNETGISSSPLAWLLNEKAINYANVAVNTLVNGKIVGSHTTISFQGLMNPFIVFLAIPGVFAALAAAWRERDEVAALGACWCLGIYLPFLLGDLSSGRVSYLYYMLLAMPGLYIVTTRLFASRRMPRAAAIGWAIALIYGFIHLYPIRTLL
ncbi:MAG: phospholipid carrier-dependent glycosyltransferase [Solirubrobacteraceae bacterium]